MITKNIHTRKNGKNKLKKNIHTRKNGKNKKNKTYRKIKSNKGGGHRVFEQVFLRKGPWCASCDTPGTMRTNTGWQGGSCYICKKPFKQGDIFNVGWGFNALYHVSCKQQQQEQYFIKQYISYMNKNRDYDEINISLENYKSKRNIEIKKCDNHILPTFVNLSMLPRMVDYFKSKFILEYGIEINKYLSLSRLRKACERIINTNPPTSRNDGIIELDRLYENYDFYSSITLDDYNKLILQEPTNGTNILPTIRDTEHNDDVISILGPVGLDYIQYKNTEIFLFPEKHLYNEDEEEIKRNNLYKVHIDIEQLYEQLLSYNLCIDLYHEGFFYRNKNILNGGSKNVGVCVGGSDPSQGNYGSYFKTSEKYKPLLYNKINGNNNFFHYGEFRLRGNKGNFIIWDILQWQWERLDYESLNGRKRFLLTYLYKPKIINKLAKCYYLDDNFENSIKEIFPDPIIKLLFNFNTLKLYNGEWVHPIRKEIMESPYKTQLETFISEHIDDIYSREGIIKLINWYMGDNWLLDSHYSDIFYNLFDREEYINEQLFFNKTDFLFTKEEVNYFMSNEIKFDILDKLMTCIALTIGDLLVDVYNLSRLLRYIDKRNTNIVLYYGGWAHPWTTRKFFIEQLNDDPNYKLHHTYGLYHQNNSFFGDNWNKTQTKDFRKNYSFEMPFTDFKTLFMRGMTHEQVRSVNLPTYEKHHYSNGFNVMEY